MWRANVYAQAEGKGPELLRLTVCSPAIRAGEGGSFSMRVPFVDGSSIRRLAVGDDAGNDPRLIRRAGQELVEGRPARASLQLHYNCVQQPAESGRNRPRSCGARRRRRSLHADERFPYGQHWGIEVSGRPAAAILIQVWCLGVAQGQVARRRCPERN